MNKRALILGIGGQDGSFLAEHLLALGYEVHGMYRRSSSDNLWRIKAIRDKINLHRGDLADASSMERIIHEVHPREIFNEADQDDINWSRSIPDYSWNITCGAVGRLLEIVARHMSINPAVRVFQPVSAVMFGPAPSPQNEETPLDPRSPFACAKAAALYLCCYYRKERGVDVRCGIMFNHDSPQRSEDYVLHKICRSAVRIARGEQKELALGNLDTSFDIGFAGDYMMAAHAILQGPESTDYCVGTGKAWTIREMVRMAFSEAGIEGDPLTKVVRDPVFYRDEPSPTLRASCDKIVAYCNWTPLVRLPALIKMIVKHAEEIR